MSSFFIGMRRLLLTSVPSWQLQRHQQLQQLLQLMLRRNTRTAHCWSSRGGGGGARSFAGAQKNKKRQRQCCFSSLVGVGRDESSSLSSSPSLPDDHSNSNNMLIDVTSLAESMRRKVRSYTQQYSSSSSPAKAVRLVGILAGETAVGSRSSPSYHSDAEIYSNRIAKTFAEDGIVYELCRCRGAVEPADVEAVIRRMNDRSDVHGILVFYPIFKDRGILQKKGPYLNKPTGVYYKTYDDYLRDVVIPSKDVEGLGYNYNARWLFRARAMNRTRKGAVYVPCTVLAVLKILETYHYHQSTVQTDKPWLGLKATVINRSEIFGRPLAALLALQGATVYSVDENSILSFMDGGKIRRCDDMPFEECLYQSNLVVTAVPSPSFLLPTEFISPGTTVIRVTPSNVDEDSLLKQPNVRLIPSIGKVTCAALEQNLCRLHRDAISDNKIDE